MGRQAQDAKRDREVDLAGGRGIPFSLSLSAATDLCDRIEAFWRRLLDRFTEAVADIESRLVSEERAERLRERIQVIRELLEEDLTLLEDVLADTLDDLPEGAASAKAEVLRLGVRRIRESIDLAQRDTAEAARRFRAGEIGVARFVQERQLAAGLVLGGLRRLCAAFEESDGSGGDAEKGT